MKHPAADRARAALSAMQAGDAEEALREALAKEPEHPDLLCELAIAWAYMQRERDAYTLFGRTEGAERRDVLGKVLCQHFYCVLQVEPEDEYAKEVFDALKPRYGGDLEHVGVGVTASLIVKNEQKHLERCLASLKGVVDEIIVVVDTKSTDRTEEIARAHGATIGHFEWCNDFSAARNSSLWMSTQPWVLSVDADEEITPECAAAIKRARLRPHYIGFCMEVVNFTEDRGLGGNEFIHTGMRMFRNLPGIKFTGKIHEQIAPSLLPFGLPWATLEGARIYHSGYTPEVISAKSKNERTITMVKESLRENPKDSFQWFNLANVYKVANMQVEAERAARAAIKYIVPSDEFGELAYEILSGSLTFQGKLGAALKVCDEADSHGYGGLFNEFQRALVYLTLGQAEEGLAAIDRCMKLEWPKGQPGDYGIYTHKRKVLRGQLLAALDRCDEALQMFDEALLVQPDMPACLFAKGMTLDKMDRHREVVEIMTKIFGDAELQVVARIAAARSLSELGEHNQAAALYKEAWTIAPAGLDAWIGWVKCCEQLGDQAGLMEAYESYSKIKEPTGQILINWGRALEASAQYERALHCFTEAIRRTPDDPNAYFNCGDLLYKMGQLADAAHLYETGLRLDPCNVEGWFTFGNSLAHLELTPQAIGCYEQVLVLNPHHVGAKHNLEVIRPAWPTSLIAS